MNSRIATYTSDLKVEEKPPRGTTILTMLTNNPLSSGIQATITAFSTANGDLEDVCAEIAVLRDQLDKKLVEREMKEGTWDGAIALLAGAILNASGGDPVAIESTGLSVPRPPEPAPALTAPLSVRARTNGSPGVTHLTWKAVRGAKLYFVQCSPDNVTWGASMSSGRTSFEAEGAEPGKVCWFRVCAVNSEGHGPWSEPARRPVM